MDPGTALGVVSLAFDVFAGCVKGFKLLVAAHNIGKDAELLVCLLRLEEYRLLQWGKQSGLADDNLAPGLDEKIVASALAELKGLLTDTERLKKRYKLDVRDQDLTSDPVTASTSSAVTGFLNNATITEEQERVLKRSDAIHSKNKIHKRLWWAAVDRNGFEELLGNISTLMQRLFDLVSAVAQQDTKDALHTLQLSVLSITEKMDDLRLVSHDIKRAVCHDDSISTVAALRRLQIHLSSIDSQAPTATTPAVPKAHKRLLAETRDGEGVTGYKYEGNPVFVERKKYSSAELAPENALQVSRRVEDLARFLSVSKSPSFRSLSCTGYFQDFVNGDFVFVFDRPPEAPETATPVSLFELLKSKHLPSSNHRFELAHSLATTILHLHASGWLHKGLRSENILFFASSKGALRTLKNPWVTGYEYARRDRPGEFSDKPSENLAHDIYRHPHAQGPVSTTYTKAFDVYSLGIVLVEIALWRPWERVLRDKFKVKLSEASPTKLQQVRDGVMLKEGSRNADAFPQTLRFYMGESYAKAALHCLGYFFEESDMDKRDWVTSFHDLVVQRLVAT